MTDTNVFENKTVAYYSLGCKLNFAEISTIGKELAVLGVRKARQGEDADLCVINTCSVTELADKKSRQLIHRIHKAHPNAYTIVTGCYAQLQPEELARIEGVDLVLGSEQKQHISLYVEDFLKNGRTLLQNIISSKVSDIRTFVPSCSTDDRTRHFLKVQDGCDYFCTYCTIPFARGRSRNGAIADIVAQARQVADSGGKEIVLTGVNIGDFGKTTGELFVDLLKHLDKVEGIERFRISSIEPDLLSEEIMTFVATSRRFMPHFHIPLQSGSDTVLQLMHRHYDTALFREKTARIRELMPDAFIGVDVIVGSRGETEELFADSLSFIEGIPFTQLHVFNYSERPGTQALKIPHRVSPQDRHERSRRLLELSDCRLREFYSSFAGQTRKVLFEHARKGNSMFGFTDNYIKTEIDYRKSLCNQIREVKLGDLNSDVPALNVKLIN